MNKTRTIKLTPEAFSTVVQAMNEYNGSKIAGVKALHRLVADLPVYPGLKLCGDVIDSLKAGHWDWFEVRYHTRPTEVVYRVWVE